MFLYGTNTILVNIPYEAVIAPTEPLEPELNIFTLKNRQLPPNATRNIRKEQTRLRHVSHSR